MEETAKAIAALHPGVRSRGYLGGFAWSALSETLVRSSLVIVVDELDRVFVESDRAGLSTKFQTGLLETLA
jgi:hypothetical protein